MDTCCLLFLLFVRFAGARISNITLTESGESGHLCLVQDFSGKAFRFSPLIITFAVGLS